MWCSPGLCAWATTVHSIINDVPNNVHTNLNFIADDSKVYSVIKTLEDSHQLQADLDNIQRMVPNMIVEA